MYKRKLGATLKKNIKLDNKVELLLGARQVGKTTLMQHLVEEMEMPYLWINGDLAIYQEYLSVRSLEKIKELVGAHKLLIINDAQNIPNVALSLKIIYDELPEVKVVVTGSSAIELSNSIQETLTGRKRVYQLFPLSLEELVEDKTKFEVKANLDQYLMYGTYPEVVNVVGAQNKKAILNEIIESYLYKDILMLSNIRRSDKIYKLLQLLAYQIGSLVSVQELAKTLGLNHETINHYLDLLEKSFVIKRVAGYAANPRKEISKMNKIYFVDVGIRNALIGNFASTDIRNDIGSLWENFIVMERLKYLSYHHFQDNIYFWKRYSGAEIDIVEQRNGKLYGIEIKWKKYCKQAPKSWTENYPNGEFRCINKDSFFEVLQD